MTGNINPQLLPVYAIIDYAWAVLKANTEMDESHYSGKIPIIPSSQQPEFTQTGKPFIVYAWSESPTDEVYTHRTGQISFAIYATEDREITKISNLLVTAFGRYDETAFNINEWKTDKIYSPLRFTSLWSGAFDGPTPETQEGGRKSAVVMVRFKYVADYQVTLP